MKKYTKKDHEKYLNQLLSEFYTIQGIFNEFIYLTNKNRKHHTTKAHLEKCYDNHTIGSLLRRLDPIAFEVSYHECDI